MTLRSDAGLATMKPMPGDGAPCYAEPALTANP
jgi:hypothetical protein